MRARKSTITKVTLDLENRDAIWLQGMLQNPILCEDQDEHPVEREIRTSMFQVLHDLKLEREN